MTGYRQPPREFLIRFEDRPGLEVVMRKIAIGPLLDMSLAADDLREGKTTAAQVTKLFADFTGWLVSWNLLDDEGRPVPATLEGVRSLDPDLFLDIFRGWSDGLMRAPKASMTPAEPSGDLSGLPMTPLRSVG